jgi:hypothetical protein
MMWLCLIRVSVVSHYQVKRFDQQSYLVAEIRIMIREHFLKLLAEICTIRSGGLISKEPCSKVIPDYFLGMSFIDVSGLLVFGQVGTSNM